MSEYMENVGRRESLRSMQRRLVAEITSHRDSIRAALPVSGEPTEIDDDYVLSLVMALRDEVQELRGIHSKIAILNRELGE